MRLSQRVFIAPVLFCLAGLFPGTARPGEATPGPAARREFRVATYNLENYLPAPLGTRPAKSAAGRAAIRESLRAINADVVALQEMGPTNALLELRDSLRAEGLDYPYWDHLSGADTNIHLAILSRFPVTRRRAHTNDAFLLFGRRFRVSRGFLEADFQVNERYSFTLLTAHLKSRRPVPEADETEWREQEALLLRSKLEARLQAQPNANIVVLGDFNDQRDSLAVRALLGRGKLALTDTRPAERTACQLPGPPRTAQPATRARTEPRAITWTHYYAKEDAYSRIDYLLLSRGMAREWNPAETYIPAIPTWGSGSDHRPLVAAFTAEDN